MLGIAMAQTGSVKTFAVVIDNHRTEADLIATVPVHIGNAEVVVALSAVRPALALPLPVQRQLVGRGVHRKSLHVVLRIAASSQVDVGLPAIQEGCSEVVLRRAVTIAVAPVAGIAAGQGIGHP